MAEVEVGILEVLANVYERLDLGWLVFGHSLFCCTLTPELKGKYFLHYWTCLLIAFGGGMLSGLLLQVEDPKVGGVAPFQNNIIGVAYTIAWWLMNYCWGDIPAKIHSLLPVRMVTKACLNVLKTMTIAMRVDQAVLVFPGVIFAHLVLGTLAGSGGKFLMDMVHGSYGHLKGPDEASAPAFSLRSAFFTALAYYLMVYVAQVMPARDCKALLTTLVILHGILQDLTNRTLDFTEHSSWLALRAVNIPHPSGMEPRKPGKKNKPAAKQD